jgi:tRNA G18 (ribose-2'-O)-methylase SpoU
MGAHFHHAALAATWAELESFRAERGVSLWGADAAGTSVDALLRGGEIPSGLAIAVGNEGSGLSPVVRERVDVLVALPIAAPVDSLNVAVATGILLYLLRP